MERASYCPVESGPTSHCHVRLLQQRMDMPTKYQQASNNLGMDVGDYLRELKEETGASDSKLAHDLYQDSGVDVSQPSVWTWRNNNV